MKNIKLILLFILTILLALIPGCAKYQVIQELRPNMYHLYHPKEGAVVILTKDSLVVNKYYKLNKIDKLNEK
tara:strand:+ start:22205 stop:22420 length:216 start_codon:yes stop_codon:yes gene_type:complete